MTTLLATAPDERHAEELAAFGQLAGHWRTDITYLSVDGEAQRRAVGDWEFSYVLDGRAVADVWRVPAVSETAVDAAREVGLCVRIWDPRLSLWRFTFHSTATSTMIVMYGQWVGDEIVLERGIADSVERWVFSGIAADRFAWRREVSTRGGEWMRRQDVVAHRLSAG